MESIPSLNAQGAGSTKHPALRTAITAFSPAAGTGGIDTFRSQIMGYFTLRTIKHTISKIS